MLGRSRSTPDKRSVVLPVSNVLGWRVDEGRGAAMAEAPVKTKPDTIVLIHGFWVTPRSWEHWKQYYEAKGYTVLTPAYPGSRSSRGAPR